MELYATNLQIAYMAGLYALQLERVSIGAVSPPFLGTVARLMGIEVEIVDMRLDLNSEADLHYNLFETFVPKGRIIFQGVGETVGDGEIIIKIGREGGVEIEGANREIEERIALFLNGGVVERGELSYDILSVGIEERGLPPRKEGEVLERERRVVEYFQERFRGNPYFDILEVGDRTVKEGYPILLKPGLYCPKEEIFRSLRERGIPVRWGWRPLYRTTLFRGDLLPVSEELYKALLVLPLREEIIEPVLEVFERYRHRGCRF